MPFKSQTQARYMFAKHPKIAKEFASQTPSIKALPDKKTSQAKALERASKRADKKLVD